MSRWCRSFSLLHDALDPQAAELPLPGSTIPMRVLHRMHYLLASGPIPTASCASIAGGPFHHLAAFLLCVDRALYPCHRGLLVAEQAVHSLFVAARQVLLAFRSPPPSRRLLVPVVTVPGLCGGNLAVPVRLKRLAAPLCVFIFGTVPRSYSSVAGSSAGSSVLVPLLLAPSGRSPQGSEHHRHMAAFEPWWGFDLSVLGNALL